jgi:3-phenylpropionate/trans-cinnamate dioxygenase ferredoxin reductase subunit
VRRPSFVIVGAGLAGARAAEALRDYGFDGRVVLVGDEPEPPYLRPPLSKGVLSGEVAPAEVHLHDEAFYAGLDIELRTATTVTHVDPGAREVVLEGGERLAYERLLLATGAQARRLSVPGGDLAGIHHLRSLADAARLRERIVRGGALAVVGGGWVGCEVAAVARQAGLDVTIIAPGRALLEHALGARVGAIYRDAHAAHGVRLLLGTHAAAFEGDGTVERVRTADGRTCDCDAVVVAAGAVPRTGLAQAAGIAVGDGIVCDEYLETGVTGVFAAGDVASALHPLFGRLRIEHWANAQDQGPVAARNMLGFAKAGDPVLARRAVYDRVPYFYSDQYDLVMECSGHAAGAEEVVLRGDPADGAFIAFWLADDRILAGMNVNVFGVTDQLQALVRSHLRVDPARLADPGTALTDLAPARG